MFQLTGVNYLKLTWQFVKANILSSMEYRVSFAVQTLGMTVNDFGLLAVWFIFFSRFPTINGWDIHATILLFCFMTMNYGLTLIFAAGSRRIARGIARGELDYFLGFPKDVLWHVSVSKTDLSALGDFIFGALLFIVAVRINLPQTLLFFGLVILTSWIVLSFVILTQSLGFYFTNFEDGAEQIVQSLLAFSFYPQIFGGWLKVIMLTILPAFFIITAPIDLVRHFNLGTFALVLGFAIFLWYVATTVFNQGLKRYESGSLINLNM